MENVAVHPLEDAVLTKRYLATLKLVFPDMHNWELYHAHSDGSEDGYNLFRGVAQSLRALGDRKSVV